MPKDQKTKCGLWEDGKRIEWFPENEVELVNNGKLDYSHYFKQSGSEEVVDRDAVFKIPATFNTKLESVRFMIDQVQLKSEQLVS